MAKRKKCIHCTFILHRMYVRINRVFTGVEYYYCSGCGSAFNIRDLVHYDKDAVEPTKEAIDKALPSKDKLRDLPNDEGYEAAKWRCPACGRIHTLTLENNVDLKQCKGCGEPRG